MACVACDVIEEATDELCNNNETDHNGAATKLGRHIKLCLYIISIVCGICNNHIRVMLLMFSHENELI